MLCAYITLSTLSEFNTTACCSPSRWVVVFYWAKYLVAGAGVLLESKWAWREWYCILCPTKTHNLDIFNSFPCPGGSCASGEAEHLGWIPVHWAPFWSHWCQAGHHGSKSPAEGRQAVGCACSLCCWRAGVCTLHFLILMRRCDEGGNAYERGQHRCSATLQWVATMYTLERPRIV